MIQVVVSAEFISEVFVGVLFRLHRILLTFSVYQSHICDLPQLGHPHVPQC